MRTARRSTRTRKSAARSRLDRRRELSDRLVAVGGVLIRHVLHHARHAWLYDLVVEDVHRERGYGTELLSFVEEWAEAKDCEYVALASPKAEERVHRYYGDGGNEKRGYVLEKEL